MLRFNDIIYGPVHSRRLGVSLGVNLLPQGGKLCNFDCIYCECGWNRDGRTSEKMPDAATVTSAMEKSLASFMQKGERIDTITFAGHGEPTLNPDFPQIMDATLELRDRYCPDASIAVLSNALTLDRPGVLSSLRKADLPILKLDAPTTAFMRAVNRPNVNVTVEEIVRNLEKMEGDFIMQTMFLTGAELDYGADREALEAWLDIVRRLHPRRIMAYTLDRPAPSEGLGKMDSAAIRRLLRPLLDEGFDIQIN
ncbi:MAG: radical SAM protein [Bacteroidales bacterium]|nr:radical SAM protein [Bacteroidales bacterium]